MPASRLVTLALLACGGCAAAADPSSEPRVALSDLAYVGSFRVPGGNLGTQDYSSFDYDGAGLAFDPARHGLFIMSHVYSQLTAEIGIPTPVAVTTQDLAGLPTATLVQEFADLTAGHRNDEGVGNGVSITGLMLYGGRLVGAVNGVYDAGGQQTLTHFTASGTLSTSDFHGLFHLASDPLPVRATAGYMTAIPDEWRSLLGGPALTGYGGGSIISGSSLGPAAFAFDPAKLGAVATVPTKPLSGYPLAHPTLGTWGGAANPVYNMCTSCSGVIFPPGTRTVLVFGSTGLGVQGYGEGTDDPSLDGKPTPDGSEWVYDPVISSKGCHAYPYAAYVWAYDANDLAQVAAGAKQPWEVTPYASGTLTLPVDSGENRINGAAYDPDTGRLYLSQAAGDRVAAYSSLPLIHVFQLPAIGSTTGGGTAGGTSSGGGSTAGGSAGSGSGGGTDDTGGGSRCGLGAALGALGLLLGLRRRSCED
jgi:hypothetical protein